MTEMDDKIIKLLEEMRATQQQQAERESKWMQRFIEINQEHLQKQRETYEASQRMYKNSYDAYKKSLRRYLMMMPVRVVFTAGFFGIIALCLLVDVILKIVGK